MSLFFFGDNFYRNKKTLKIFSPQIMEIYRILLVESTLESIMFYYNFLVINTMFVPCTALLHHSTAATLNIKIVHNLIEHLLWNPSNFFSNDVLSYLWIVFTNSVFQVHSTPESSQKSWDLGNRMVRGYQLVPKWIYPMGSYAWGIQVFCLRNEVPPHFSNRTL